MSSTMQTAWYTVGKEYGRVKQKVISAGYLLKIVLIVNYGWNELERLTDE